LSISMCISTQFLSISTDTHEHLIAIALSIQHSSKIEYGNHVEAPSINSNGELVYYSLPLHKSTRNRPTRMQSDSRHIETMKNRNKTNHSIEIKSIENRFNVSISLSCLHSQKERKRE